MPPKYRDGNLIYCAAFVFCIVCILCVFYVFVFHYILSLVVLPNQIKSKFIVKTEGTRSMQKVQMTRMWANAKRDGRSAEYRWRHLFNAAKFG